LADFQQFVVSGELVEQAQTFAAVEVA